MSPCYFSFGLGYQSGDPIIPVRKQNSKYNFNGFILSYNRSIQENNYGKRDWGTSLQYAIYSFGKNLPFVTAVEANYKSVSHKKHFGIKPGVGFTYKCFNLVYGYNFDFNKNPEQRISQHEILLSYWFKLEI
ncbi:MAG: hypothetical protein GC181_10295 [Bacteroidetes bacterium]|nr:hypothetical protein [Bacteroidota bacterium]